MPSLLLHNPPPPLGDKYSKIPTMPPEIPLAKGGITPNLLPSPKPLLGSLNNAMPSIKLPFLPPLPGLPSKEGK